MKRTTARRIHEITNAAYWIENPNWRTGIPIADAGLRAVRALPFGVHESLKRLFYDAGQVIAVSGETVVAVNGPDKVDKFMFRYPGKMALQTFKEQATTEVGFVTRYLAGIALPTQVSIKPATVFRRPKNQLDTVTQTQPRLNLDIYTALDLKTLQEERPSPILDKTVNDLEILLAGTSWLADDHGYYPDIADSAGNLQRNNADGSVTLIDVMPFYENGSRLIGDRPPGVVSHIQNNIANYQAFVGQYGS